MTAVLEEVDLGRVAVIVPALNPDRELCVYAAALLSQGFGRVIVVDDGSSGPATAVFDELRADARLVVLTHAVNFGKGRALKTAFNHCLANYPELAGVVTADADGQHSVEDVVNVAAMLLQQSAQGHQPLVLGVRDFDRDVPLRSQVGNQLTRLVFRILYGVRVRDTQTGLRGLPLSMLTDLLTVEGERYEYEASMLIASATTKRPIVEVPIKTIYLDGNKSSHFNVVMDSMRIYFLLLRFFLSSMLTTVIDFGVFILAFAVSDSLLTAMLCGRIVALCFNFMMNKHLVFRMQSGGVGVFIRYVALVALMAALSYSLINVLQAGFGIGTLIAKLLAESILFVLSFAAQRELVFAKAGTKHEAD